MSGLANRLRGLAASIAIGELLSLPVYFRWTSDWACPGNYEDCFVDDFSTPCSWESAVASSSIRIGFGGVKPGGSPESYLSYLPLNLHQEFRDRWPQKLRLIRLQTDLREAVDRYFSSITFGREIFHGTGPIIGVHVRRTDFVPDCRRKWGQVVDDADVFSEINRCLEENPSSRFLLCTDNPETERTFFEKHGNVVFARPKSWNERRSHKQRLTSLSDAVIDLYLLAKCNTIIGTRHSSFGRVASIIGDVPATFV